MLLLWALSFFSLVIVEMTEHSVLLAMCVWCVGNQLMNPSELIQQMQLMLLLPSVITFVVMIDSVTVQTVRHYLVEIILVSGGHVSFGSAPGIVTHGKVQFSELEQSNRFIFSGNQILLDLTLSMHRTTEILRTTDF